MMEVSLISLKHFKLLVEVNKIRGKLIWSWIVPLNRNNFQIQMELIRLYQLLVKQFSQINLWQVLTGLLIFKTLNCLKKYSYATIVPSYFQISRIPYIVKDVSSPYFAMNLQNNKVRNYFALTWRVKEVSLISANLKRIQDLSKRFHAPKFNVSIFTEAVPIPFRIINFMHMKMYVDNVKFVEIMT